MAKKTKVKVKVTENRRRTIAGAEKSLGDTREVYATFEQMQSSLVRECESQIDSWTKTRDAAERINK